MSYTSLQAGMLYFVNKYGSISYKSSSDGLFVLGDPICDLKNTDKLLFSFLKEHPNSHFFYCSSSTVQHLEKYYYTPTIMGTEHSLNLPNFKGSWSAQSSLRSGYNKHRNSFSFRETSINDLDSQHLRSLYSLWLNQKEHPSQISFMCRPFTFMDDPYCRYFIAHQKNTVYGVLRLSPTFNKSSDYFCDHVFFNPNYSSLKDYMLFSVISLLKSECKQQLYLGLSPFSNLSSKLSVNTLLFKLIYTFNQPRFGYKGIHKYLTKFHATKEPKYFATVANNSIPILWKTWKMMST